MELKIFSKFSKYKMNRFDLALFGLRLLKTSFGCAAYRSFGFPVVYPKFARISITNRCDSKCTTCHIWNYYTRFPEKERLELTFNEFKQFVDNNPFLQDIILTGGQVTLHPDLLDMWLYLDKKGYRTGGPTNAVNLTKIKKIQQEALERLSGKNVHFLTISIDGLDDMHDKGRGVKGDFKRAIKLVEWVQSKQKEFPFLQLNISHNITPDNHEHFLAFVDYFVNFGLKATQITFRPTQSLERYKLLNTKGTIQQKDIKNKVLKSIKLVIDQYPELDSYYLRKLPNYYTNPSKQVIPCYAGFSSLFIDTYWNVFPCTAMESFRIGNLRKTEFKLKKIMVDTNAKKIQQVIRNNKCPNCWIRCYSGYSMLSNPINLFYLALEKAGIYNDD